MIASKNFLLILGILILAACAPPPATQLATDTEAAASDIPQEITSTPQDTPYPGPPAEQITDPVPYPPPTIEILPIDAYPAPDSTNAVVGSSAFQLDKPILEGTTEITGVGPAGVPILIIDITFMGEIMGSGVIDSNGTFSIQVDALEKAHRIGITIDNLEDTQWTQEDFYGSEFNGEDPMQVPMVGYFYDTAIILEE